MSVARLAAVTLLAAWMPTIWAATIPLRELPTAIVAQLHSGTIEMNVIDGRVQSDVSGFSFNAYRYERGGDSFFLVQYDVQPGSQWDTSSSDPLPLAGRVFVEVPQLYTSGNARFTLHLDQLDSNIGYFIFEFNLPYTVMELLPDAMAAGAGVYEFSGEPDYIASGDMAFVDNAPLLCVECSFFAQFNLIFLDYGNGSLQFDFNDPRTVLFSGVDSYEDSPYGWGLDLVVSATDLDGDGVPDTTDNCLAVANAGQTDTDADGFGNHCDADFNNDCRVNFADLQAIRAVFPNFLGQEQVFDLNGDGNVNFIDLQILRQLVFLPPGPAAMPTACQNNRASG